MNKKVDHKGMKLEGGREAYLGICDNGDVSLVFKRPLFENDEPSAISVIEGDSRVTSIRLTEKTMESIIFLYFNEVENEKIVLHMLAGALATAISNKEVI